LSECDAIHCAGLAPIFALRTKKPYIFHATGWDMNVIPFKKFPDMHFVLSKLQREAIMAAEYIIAAGGYFHNSIEKLGIANKVIRIPLIVDVEKFKPFSTIKIEEVKKKLGLCGIDFVFFHPSRHMWQSLQREDLTKGNDKLIKAYAQFVKKNKEISSRLICIEAGEDVGESKKLITKLGIQDNIIWIPHQIREELIKYYAISDIIFDFFGYGTYGVVTIEAMAMGKPVCVHLDNNVAELMGLDSTPPITNVNTEEEIFHSISENTIDKFKLENQGQMSREWVLENHYSKPTEKYLNLYKKITG
jgi:glycosyltransferase involved in cell wall biosynthesis